MAHKPPPQPLFKLGHICATPAAKQALDAEGVDVIALLKRHMSGDWGDLTEGEKSENQRAVEESEPVVSAYILPRSAVKIAVITEANRSKTTFLMPEGKGQETDSLPL